MIQYIEGDALQGGGYRVIAHVCNDMGVWGAGFVIPLAQKYPSTKKHYQKAHLEGRVKLGFTQLVGVSPTVVVANMVAQTLNNDPVRVKYDYLGDCLRKVATMTQTLSISTGKTWEVHMPRIGTGLGGGDWNMIEPLLFTHLDKENIPVKVFTLPEVWVEG